MRVAFSGKVSSLPSEIQARGSLRSTKLEKTKPTRGTAINSPAATLAATPMWKSQSRRVGFGSWSGPLCSACSDPVMSFHSLLAAAAGALISLVALLGARAAGAVAAAFVAFGRGSGFTGPVFVDVLLFVGRGGAQGAHVGDQVGDVLVGERVAQVEEPVIGHAEIGPADDDGSAQQLIAR